MVYKRFITLYYYLTGILFIALSRWNDELLINFISTKFFEINSGKYFGCHIYSTDDVRGMDRRMDGMQGTYHHLSSYYQN